METVNAWHIYSSVDSFFLLKNDRTVFSLTPNPCDISFAEHHSAYKASI